MLHKPSSLRAMLLDKVPALKADPSLLSMFIDKGKVISRATGNPAFQYRYTLNIVVQDYAGDIDALILPILLWVGQEEPELLERAPHEPIRYESEILDASSADVSIYIELSERVLVARDAASGTYTTSHLDDRYAPPAWDAEGATLQHPSSAATVCP
jgi:hypothetical protein